MTTFAYSELPSFGSFHKEYRVVKIAKEAIAEDPEPWQALEVLGKTSQWRLAAEHVLNMTDLEQDNLADLEAGQWPDSNKMNDNFYKLYNRYHIESVKLSAICSLILKASEKNSVVIQGPKMKGSEGKQSSYLGF